MARYTWSPSMAAFNASQHDDVEISKELFDQLFEGQSNGMTIMKLADGMPALSEAELPSAEDAASYELSRLASVANQQISTLKPAVDGGYAQPEHVQLLSDWQRYRYELINVPSQPEWPDSPQWPVQPLTII